MAPRDTGARDRRNRPWVQLASGYYDWVADQLTSVGLAVFAIDLRGRGQSDGERFYVTKSQNTSTTSRGW